jgi:hypothetical protein
MPTPMPSNLMAFQAAFSTEAACRIHLLPLREAGLASAAPPRGPSGAVSGPGHRLTV